MYVVIRHFKVDPDMIDETAEVAKNKFLPDLVAIPGFKAYYQLHAGEDEIASVSVFADKAGADASERLARQCIEEHLPDVLLEPPVTIEGDVMIEEVAESFITRA